MLSKNISETSFGRQKLKFSCLNIRLEKFFLENSGNFADGLNAKPAIKHFIGQLQEILCLSLYCLRLYSNTFIAKP